MVASARSAHVTLPAEMIEAIIQHVDWRTLLYVRLSSRALNQISRSTTFWRKQYMRYMAAVPNMAPLESPLEEYSSFELEEAVMRRLTAEDGWTSTQEKPTFMFTTECRAMQRTKLHIVEGGRWLLASTEGAMIVYDLDNPQEKGRLLIPRPPGLTGGRATTNLSVDILRDAPVLTFNVAIAQYELELEDPDGELVWTHMWRVTMEGHGISAKLQAKYIKSFRKAGEMVIANAVCLRGPLYARAIHYLYVGFCIEVYSWADSGPLMHLKAVFTFDKEADYIRLLPNNRILILAENCIELYNIPPFEQVSPSADSYRGSTITGYNSLTLPGKRFVRGEISPLRFDKEDGCKFACSTDMGIFAVSISPNFSSAHMVPAVTVTVNEYDDTGVTDVLLGARRIYIRHYEHAELWEYDTDQAVVHTDGSQQQPISQRAVPKDFAANLRPVMDETSGRVAMAASSSSLSIFYYSLYDRTKYIVQQEGTTT